MSSAATGLGVTVARQQRGKMILARLLQEDALSALFRRLLARSSFLLQRGFHFSLWLIPTFGVG